MRGSGEGGGAATCVGHEGRGVASAIFLVRQGFVGSLLPAVPPNEIFLHHTQGRGGRAGAGGRRQWAAGGGRRGGRCLCARALIPRSTRGASMHVHMHVHVTSACCRGGPPSRRARFKPGGAARSQCGPRRAPGPRAEGRPPPRRSAGSLSAAAPDLGKGAGFGVRVGRGGRQLAEQDRS